MTEHVINESFRDWAATRNFPFTDESDLTCMDGRRLPVSAFVCISLYPDTEGSARLSLISVDRMVITLGQTWEAIAYFTDLKNNWIPLKHGGNIVGSIMLNEDDIDYVKGMASTEDMVFNEGHANIRPELVRGFCADEEILFEPPTFFSLPSTNMTYSFISSRYTVNQTDVDMNVTVSYSPDATAITKIKIGDTSYSLCNDGHLLIRTPIWCDTQFISSDNGILFHQRGA
jgi:hypothetical protein